MQLYTSANAVLMITWPSLFNAVAQRIDNFAKARAWEISDQVSGETRMSMDGKQNVAWVPNPVDFAVTLEPGAKAIQLFADWKRAEKLKRTKYKCNASIKAADSVGSVTLVNGVMISWPPFPSADDSFNRITFHMRFEDAEAEFAQHEVM